MHSGCGIYIWASRAALAWRMPHDFVVCVPAPAECKPCMPIAL
jgi:hypothetical protein